MRFTPEKPNPYMTISVSKLHVPCCSPYRGTTFPHSYAWLRSLFLDKTHLCETSNIFYLVKYDFSQKTGDVI